MIPKDKTKVASLTGVMGQKVDEWSVWYSGDTTRLANFYAHFILEKTPNGRYWSQIDREERLNVVHEPLASDIARVASNLLFSEPAEIQYDDTGKSGGRLTNFIEENGLQSKLLEGAELAAAMGGVYMKLDVDEDVSSVPIVTNKTPEMVIPDFRYGRLTGVTFWSIIGTDSKDKIYRLFEHRANENGNLMIIYALFKGDKDHIGQQVPLDTFEETAGYQDVSYPNFQGLGCVYIPNSLPNRLYPNSSQGVADYADCISLMDSLDETMTSWMRDLTLGQARIFADSEMFTSDLPIDPNFPNVGGREGGSRFDPFHRIYQKVDLSGWKLDGGSAKPIDQVQFKIRVDEHAKTAEELIIKIVSRSGYSPQSFGMDVEGRAESGTALRMKERKSLMTQAKKAKYWAPQLQRLFFEMQQLDQATRLSSQYEIQDVKFIPADSVVFDQKETAETIRNLEQAKAISTEMKVRMAHPDYGEEEIEAEVERINREQGATIPDPFQND